MSLFGTSPDERPSLQSKSSLFDDDKPAKSGSKQASSSGLFADGDGDEGDSPWGFPTPKKQSRANPVKTLIPADDAPDSYVDAFDALLESDRAGNGASFGALQRVLGECGLSAEVQAQISRIIQQGLDGREVVGRAEFNVFLALVGLGQEGEETTLDGVDERRRRLPIPRLPQLRKPKPPQQQQEQPLRQEAPQEQTAPRPAVAGTQSYGGFSDADPWATSPPATRPTATAAFGNDRPSNGATPQRTTSTFTTNEETSNTTPRQDPPLPTTQSISSEGWDAYNGGAASDYSITSGFGDQSEISTQRATTRTNRAIQVNRGVEEVVTVNSIEGKEGMFLFQHRNYEVASTRRNSKVVRRYSDFVWLLDCLHKKYPFRQLPLLPPKRVAINGNHIAADTLFIEKRRRGLARFVNALVRHPVLNQEQLVIMFLTVPTELSVWRKQATISITDEFTGKPLPPNLESSLPESLEELFDTVRQGVKQSTEIYITLCTLLERLIKRQEGLATDYTRFSTALSSLTSTSSSTYKIDENDVPLLNEGLHNVAKHVTKHQGSLVDEAVNWDEGVLEDFKRQRDGLVSMRDMFERRERLDRSGIPGLERRIQASEGKLAQARAKPEGARKPGEVEKIEEAIRQDKASIADQHARSIFIKECLRDEILAWQSSQYHVSRMHQDWSQERLRFAEVRVENWRGLGEEVEGMPLGE